MVRMACTFTTSVVHDVGLLFLPPMVSEWRRRMELEMNTTASTNTSPNQTTGWPSTPLYGKGGRRFNKPQQHYRAVLPLSPNQSLTALHPSIDPLPL